MSSFPSHYSGVEHENTADTPASRSLESRVRDALDELQTENHYGLERVLADPTFFVLQLQRNLNGTSTNITDAALKQYVLTEAVQFKPHFSPDEDDDD